MVWFRQAVVFGFGISILAFLCVWVPHVHILPLSGQVCFCVLAISIFLSGGTQSPSDFGVEHSEIVLESGGRGAPIIKVRKGMEPPSYKVGGAQSSQTYIFSLSLGPFQGREMFFS
jgi:hypothetical protein